MRADPGDQVVMVCSRQVGKSSTVALKAGRIVADGGRVVVVSPTQRQSGLLFRQVRDHLTTAGVALSRETATEVETADGASRCAFRATGPRRCGGTPSATTARRP